MRNLLALSWPQDPHQLQDYCTLNSVTGSGHVKYQKHCIIAWLLDIQPCQKGIVHVLCMPITSNTSESLEWLISISFSQCEREYLIIFVEIHCVYRLINIVNHPWALPTCRVSQEVGVVMFYVITAIKSCMVGIKVPFTGS